jgi:cobalt transporter subunit CbtA
MTARIIIAAALAGLIAGLVVSVVQQFRITPLIVAAEQYEQAGGHDHAGAPDQANNSAAVDSHADQEAWAPRDGMERTLFTLAANIVAGVGFALVLAAASLLTGLPLNLANGAVWGLAGFAAFMLAPSAGLPPELPGMPAADLAARQAWWWATVAATGIAIVLAVCFVRPWAWIAGLVLVLLPHVFGAPQPLSHDSAVPAALATSFAANAIVAQAVFWVVLGTALGHLMARLSHPPQEA